MIKRRFYKLEHGDRDAPSESSSSSDSEFEAEASEEEEDWEEEEEEDEDDTKEKNDGDVRLIAGNESSSGYESEHSSADEVNLDSSGLPTSDEDFTTLKDAKLDSETHLVEKRVSELDNTPNNLIPKEEGDIPHDASDYVLKCKSVFKCRVCPRIVCLTVQTLNAHLKSKRHARSEKLLKEGRLKLMLSEDGKIEGEIHPEETSNGEQKASAPKKFKKNKGLKRERKGKKLKKNKENSSPMENDRESRKNQSKKRQKNK